MKLFKRHPIILIPIGLLLAFLILPFFGRKDVNSTQKSTTSIRKSKTIGFLDYDLLPEAMKQKMEALVEEYPERTYIFTYFFENDDLHHRYFMIDTDTEVISPQPVNDTKTLELVEQRITEHQGAENGINHVWHPDFYDNKSRDALDKLGREKIAVTYVIPKEAIDYQQLRVAIVEQTYMRPEKQATGSYQIPDTDIPVYFAEDVETLPEPVRGINYFREVVMKDALESEVFKFYDLKGKITIEFLVWATQAQSPNLIEGYSTKEDSYEAYRADGAFIKAVNRAKVRWKSGLLNGKPVRTKMRLTFEVDTAKK